MRGIYRPQDLVDSFRSVSRFVLVVAATCSLTVNSWDSYVFDEVPASQAIEAKEQASRTADLLINYTKEHLSEANGTSVGILSLPGAVLLTCVADS